MYVTKDTEVHGCNHEKEVMHLKKNSFKIYCLVLPSVVSVGKIVAKLLSAALAIIGSVANGARKANILSRLKVLGEGVLKP